MRLPDWEDRLQAFIEANRTREFVWGEWDCILYATACAAELTGEDKAAAYRGQYSDREGAARILREIGQGTLLRTVDSNFPRRPVALARRGDLVWHEGAVGVCMGADALFVGEYDTDGLFPIPRARLMKAWTV